MFRVTIETNSAAFGPDAADTYAEVARILREIADRIADEPTSRFTVRDINGNTVGRAGFGR